MKDSARINHYEALMKKIVGFRTDDKYCDVDIIVKERTFKCHRLILGAASKYFDRMFSGDFREGSAKEITLHEVETDLFKNLLRFVYEGDIEVIHSSNVYSLICAAEFYELPSLEEFCVGFVRANLNEIASDVLKIFSFAHNLAKENLVELLSRHIHENFHYFSKASDFYEFTFNQVEKVLDAFGRDGQQAPVLQDVLYEGINEWVRHQVNSSAEEKEYFRRLFGKIDYKNISLEYLHVACFVKKYDKNRLPSESVANDDASATASEDEMCPSPLYAYISRRSEDGSSTNRTSIFSLRGTLGSYTAFPFRTWLSSGELKYAYDFLRIIVIDDRLYSLGYSNEDQYPQQTFMTSTSVSMYPYTPLKPPPLILDEFDLCGTGDYIYVYNKKKFTSATIQTCGDPTFSVDQLSHGMYTYKRDADEWLPLPYPRIRFDDACMTCDKKLVYLIGGTNSGGLVQTYDVRTQGWSIISHPTIGVYESAACCVAGDKVYVAGGKQNPARVEMYDPVSGRWQQMETLLEDRYDKHKLLNWSILGRLDPIIVSFSNRESPRSNILTYSPTDEERNILPWLPLLPHVLDSAQCRNGIVTDRIHILDMVGY